MIEKIFNIGLTLLVIDFISIIFFIFYAHDIYSDKYRVGPGDGVFGPLLFLIWVIFPITLIQLCLFIFLFLRNTSIISYFGYSISHLSFIIIIIELIPIVVIFLIFNIDKFFPNIKKTKISNFFYKKFLK
tara:strand:+ start:573 stop:962 length:390 start_codon:yes stop_codon:yes gene_type:complete